MVAVYTGQPTIEEIKARLEAADVEVDGGTVADMVQRLVDTNHLVQVRRSFGHPMS